mgnify:CR=1 FL=1
MFSLLKNPSQWQEKFKSLKPSARWTIILVTSAIVLILIGTLAGTGNEPENTPSLATLGLDVLLKLGIVLILIYISAYLLRRFGTIGIQHKTKSLSICETLSLTPKRAIYIIKAGNYQFLIGATDQSITLLKQLEPLSGEKYPKSISDLEFLTDQIPMEFPDKNDA